jgi:hypothetical protein
MFKGLRASMTWLRLIAIITGMIVADALIIGAASFH